MNFPRVLSPRLGALLGAGAAGLLAYARFVEPNWLQVRHVRLRLPRLSPEFDGYTLVQISDLHMEQTQRWDLLQQAIEISNGLKPDLVAITGDFVTRHAAPVADRLAALLRQFKAADGVVAVRGNHDYWGDIDQVKAMLADAGLCDLSNTVLTLRRGDAALHLAGVDSAQEAEARFDLIMPALAGDNFAAVLLAHEPDTAYLSAALERFDLQLSGHTHGGQVRIPMLMQYVLPPLSQGFTAGLYRIGKMYVYTNRGLGWSGWRLRFLCRPEVTVFTLYAGEQ